MLHRFFNAIGENEKYQNLDGKHNWITALVVFNILLLAFLGGFLIV